MQTTEGADNMAPRRVLAMRQLRHAHKESEDAYPDKQAAYSFQISLTAD